MSVAEVSRRMTRLRNWTRYEIWAVATWTVIFTILFFWIMDYYTLPLMIQARLARLLHHPGCTSYLFHI